MEESINNILSHLGRTIEAQSTSASKRENAYKAQLARLAEGLSALANLCSSNDNGAAELTGDDAMPHRTPKRSAMANRTSCLGFEDDLFLDALTTEWIGAGKLHRLLTGRGIKIGEGTVYNRMRKLCAERPDEIDAATKPERWRRKFPIMEVVVEPSVTSKVARRRKRTTAIPQLRTDRNAPAPANDNLSEVHLPKLHQGDCLEIMGSIPDHSVDLILADLPYAVTRCDWDKAIPLDKLWEHYRRLIKATGVIVLFAAQPFTTMLGASNLDWLKYALVWSKRQSSGFLQAKNKPLISHEDILIFSPGAISHAGKSKRRMTYNPQGVSSRGQKLVTDRRSLIRHLGNARPRADRVEYEAFTGYPSSILDFTKDRFRHGDDSHPFSKPIDLLEYLIRTYSHPGEVVLDNTMGSGSTCIAAMRTGRRSIGIELGHQWFEVAQARIGLASTELQTALPCQSHDAEGAAA